MKIRFKLYRISKATGESNSIIYLQEVKYKKPVFTAIKSNARGFTLLLALYYGIRFFLSIIPESLA
jgi:hypothetical protein